MKITIAKIIEITSLIDNKGDNLYYHLYKEIQAISHGITILTRILLNQFDV